MGKGFRLVAALAAIAVIRLLAAQVRLRIRTGSRCTACRPVVVNAGACQDQHPLGIQDAVNHAEPGETVFVGVGHTPSRS